MQRSLLSQLKQLAPALVTLTAAACLWLALRVLVQQIPGPPGFDVTIRDHAGNIVAHERAPILLTPEIAPTPPLGASLTARATYLAREAGKYTWQLGCTSWCSLSVDGVVVHQPRPGRVAGKEQLLEPGLHELEVTMPNADAAGGVAFGLRLPSAPWRSPLLGPGDVVAARRADVARRIGAQPIALLHLLVVLPFLLTLFTFLLVWQVIGAARRARVRSYVAGLAASPLALTLFTSALLAGVILPMVGPLFAPGFYACHEEESYIVRLIEYHWSISGGVPMGRWWPDPVLGRGYPFLCLYAPLLYIVATPFLLLGVPSLSTVKIISGLLVIVGTVATYVTARRRASRPAALLAAALFTYAPYLQTDLWVRADLAESLGFACFPLAIMTLDRILDRRAPAAPPPYAAVAGLALTLFALGACHNITAYFSIYFLTLWLIMRVALRTTDRAGLLRAVLGGGLGLWLTISYAVPAIGDAHRVFMERVMTGYYYALGNFVPADKVLWTEPRWGMRTVVGVPGSIALFTGLAAVLARRPSGEKLRGGTPGARGLALLAAAGVVLALLLATKPVGPFVVKNIPLAEYVQFPWRMFLFAGCLAPLCVPAAVDGFFTLPRLRWTVAVLAIAAVMVDFGPQFGPQAPLVRSHLDVEKFLRSLEIDYVTSMNEYLPRTVKRTVPRFGDVAHVIDGSAQLSGLTRAPGTYDAVVDAAAPALVEFNAHWFPGWRARLDGAEVKIGPGQARFDEGGLIRVQVPPGHHAVALRYGRTPLRLACDLFSLVGLIVTLALLVLAARQKLLRYRRAQEG
jgi:hypothetical protein